MKGSQMRSTELQVLVDLAWCDQRLLVLRHDVYKVQQELLEKQHFHTQFQEHFSAIQYEFHQLKKDIDVQERYLQELQVKEDSLKLKMNDLRSPKEYAACLKEVENLENMRSTQETIVLQLWETFPETEVKYHQEMKLIQQSIDAVLVLIKNLEYQISLQTAEIEKIDQNRKDAMLDMQGDWINLYSVMHRKVANPMVHVREQNCSGCSYAINPLDMQLLQHKKLLQCQNCYRILFYKE